MTLIETVEKWKKDLEDLSVEKGKAEGRYEQAMDALRELGFETIEDAKDELDRLTQKKLKAEEDVKELLETFKEKYADYIE